MDMAMVVVILSVLLTIPVLPAYWHPIKCAAVLFRCSPGTFSESLFGTTTPCGRNSSTRQERQYHWRNKIGQYSLIEDFDRRSFKKICIVWFKGTMLSQVSPIAIFIKHHPVEEEDVTVPDSVRKLVGEALQVMDGLPTNGTRSLKSNAVVVQEDLTWICRQRSHAHTILIWHIATSYCDTFLKMSSNNFDDHEVATTLSRYCAYLVAFLPEFLSEFSFKTTLTFQQVVQEARNRLGRARISLDEKRQMIEDLRVPQGEAAETTFEKGIFLGRQLEQLNSNNLAWKVMAEFWAETILYVAPSDDAALHIDHLAKGGEFVTHLWALLSNAGILKRATEEWTEQASGGSQINTEEIEAAENQPQDEPVGSDSGNK